MYFDYSLHAFSAGVLLVVLYAMYSRRGFLTTHINLFYLILGINFALLALDVIADITRHMRGYDALFLRYLVHTIYYSMVPLSGFSWALYAHYVIHLDLKRLLAFAKRIFLPILLNVVLLIVNIFIPLVFEFTYLGGEILHWWYVYPVLLTFAYVLLSAFLSYHHRVKMKKIDMSSLILFIFPPFVSGVLEVVFNLEGIIWPAMTVSVLFMYISIQGQIMSTDYLTRVANRYQLDQYVSQLMNRLPTGKQIGGLMIDIDEFKQINDVYGHNQGDNALSITADILRSSVRKTDFVARFGGDEFVVVCLVNELIHLEDIIERIQANVKLFNQERSTQFSLSLSIGHGIYHADQDQSVASFLEHLDVRMYDIKKSRLEPKK